MIKHSTRQWNVTMRHQPTNQRPSTADGSAQRTNQDARPARAPSNQRLCYKVCTRDDDNDTTKMRMLTTVTMVTVTMITIPLHPLLRRRVFASFPVALLRLEITQKTNQYRLPTRVTTQAILVRSMIKFCDISLENLHRFDICSYLLHPPLPHRCLHRHLHHHQARNLHPHHHPERAERFYIQSIQSLKADNRLSRIELQ